MDEHSGNQPAARPAPAALGALGAAVGALGMAAAARTLTPAAAAGHGSDVLIAWVLVVAAVLGAALCAYLALIWSLASMVLLAGPATRGGTAALAALRLLAPRIARRLSLGAALATTTTGLVLAPAVAGEIAPSPAADPGPGPVAHSAELETSEPPGSEQDPSGSLPPLGWSGDPSAASGASAPAGSSGPTPSDGTSAAPDDAPASPPTVVVQPGDTLWSITDDLLAPAPDSPSTIAAGWPLLHDANREAIGDDPDLLVPGQVLTVPTSLTPQEAP
ncbi:LysM peptidoglycan-binding domain-containing protein [Brachybacterium sp. YJGR34]|uniref:LysM peptidoglycan-binding domain-containing protein n=1 Tax=Brachybacterium sp. YJGR34 TaxID=2059911 RepID=UPI000E0CA43A|nr:LysM domain-containing protein [Brachybacterium sp. YJGR34]